MMKNKAKIQEFLRGEISEKELQEIIEWVELSEDNKKEFQQLQLLDFANEYSSHSKEINTEAVLANTHKRIERKRQFYRTMSIYARRSVFLLFIPLAVLVAYLLGHPYNPDPQPIEVRTQPGMIADVILPDSTEVILNSSSVIQYPSFFKDDERRVVLYGEAYFKVKKDSGKPFKVVTSAASEIEVYGTEFNVEVNEHKAEVRTTLVTGNIGFVYSKQGDRKVVNINPGEKLTYKAANGKAPVVEQANIEVETSWKDGYYVFKNTSLEDILSKLEKRYNVYFEIKDRSLLDMTFTATIRDQSLDRVLEGFNISSKIKFVYVSPDSESNPKIIKVFRE